MTKKKVIILILNIIFMLMFFTFVDTYSRNLIWDLNQSLRDIETIARKIYELKNKIRFMFLSGVLYTSIHLIIIYYISKKIK